MITDAYLMSSSSAEATFPDCVPGERKTIAQKLSGSYSRKEQKKKKNVLLFIKAIP